MRFFDFPKGPRNGEAYRHEVLQEAKGRIVAYLCDDDLLLPDHVAAMSRVLADADFAHPVTTRFTADGELEYFPWNSCKDDVLSVAPLRLPYTWPCSVAPCSQ